MSYLLRSLVVILVSAAVPTTSMAGITTDDGTDCPANDDGSGIVVIDTTDTDPASDPAPCTDCAVYGETENRKTADWALDAKTDNMLLFEGALYEKAVYDGWRLDAAEERLDVTEERLDAAEERLDAVEEDVGVLKGKVGRDEAVMYAGTRRTKNGHLVVGDGTITKPAKGTVMGDALRLRLGGATVIGLGPNYILQHTETDLSGVFSGGAAASVFLENLKFSGVLTGAAMGESSDIGLSTEARVSGRGFLGDGGFLLGGTIGTHNSGLVGVTQSHTTFMFAGPEFAFRPAVAKGHLELTGWGSLAMVGWQPGQDTSQQREISARAGFGATGLF